MNLNDVFYGSIEENQVHFLRVVELVVVLKGALSLILHLVSVSEFAVEVSEWTL